jgi:hypothetical protein
MGVFVTASEVLAPNFPLPSEARPFPAQKTLTCSQSPCDGFPLCMHIHGAHSVYGSM